MIPDYLQCSGPYTSQPDGVWDIQDCLGSGYVLVQPATLRRTDSRRLQGAPQENGDLGVHCRLSLKVVAPMPSHNVQSTVHAVN